MSNKVFLANRGIIEIHVIDDQTPESVQQLANATEVLLVQLDAEHKPKLILDDLTRIGNTSSAARKAVSDAAKRLNYDKIAMVGKGGLLMKYGTNLMIQAIGKGNKIRYFESRDEANQWLFGS